MSPRRRTPTLVLHVKRRCLVCDAETDVTEPSETDQIGPLCEQCHAPTERVAVLSRRVAGPAMFSTTWSYIDHVLAPPGASTPELPHDGVAEAYYVLGGEGTLSVTGAESGSATVRAGDAIPIRIGETSRFTSTGSVPLELFVMGVARDAAAKAQLLTSAPR